MQTQTTQAAPQPSTVPVPKQATAKELAAQIKALQARKAVVAEQERKNKPPRTRGNGVLAAAKRLVYANPKISIDELEAACKKTHAKVSRSSLETLKPDFMHSMRVLKEMGALTSAAQAKVS